MDILKEIFKSYKKNDEKFVDKIVSIINILPKNRQLLLEIEKSLPYQDDKLMSKSLSIAWKDIWIKNVDKDDRELLEKYFPLIGFNHQKKIKENIGNKFELQEIISLNQAIKDYKNGDSNTLDKLIDLRENFSNTEKKRILSVINGYFIEGSLPLFTKLLEKYDCYYQIDNFDESHNVLNSEFNQFKKFLDISLLHSNEEETLKYFLNKQSYYNYNKLSWPSSFSGIINNLTKIETIDNIVYLLEKCRNFLEKDYILSPENNILKDLMENNVSKDYKVDDFYIKSIKKLNSYLLQKELNNNLEFKEQKRSVKI